MKVRDLIRQIEADGWYHIKTTGSHRHYQHPTEPGKVTIPGHPNDDVPPGTLASILRQAGLKGK